MRAGEYVHAVDRDSGDNRIVKERLVAPLAVGAGLRVHESDPVVLGDGGIRVVGSEPVRGAIIDESLVQ